MGVSAKIEALVLATKNNFGGRAERRADMKLARPLKYGVLALLVFGLAACSSSGTIEVKQGLSEDIPPGKIVALEVDAITEDSDADEVAEARQRMSSDLFGRLVAEGIFAQVVQAGQPADYDMTVVMSGIDEVSTGARIFFGVFAGADELVADVALQNNASQQQIAKFTVTGESASHPLSSETGMEDAVREAVNKIIGELR